MIDSLKRAVLPAIQPTQRPPAPRAPSALPPASGSNFTEAVVAPVALTVPSQEQLPAASPEEQGAPAAPRTRSLPEVRLGDEAREAIETFVVTRDMTPSERSAFDALPEEEQAAYVDAYQTARRSGDPGEEKKLRTALEAGAMPGYLSLPADEKERVDQLYADTEGLDPQARSEARAQITKLIKEDKVSDYLAVERGGSEDAELQALLFSGELNGIEEEGHTLLDYMTQVATGEGETTGQGFNRGKLIDQMILDVRHGVYEQPEGNNDCLALAILGDTARKNPAAYGRRVTELAEDGETTLPGPDGEPLVVTYRGPPPENGELNPTQELFTQMGEDLDLANRRTSDDPMVDALLALLDKMDGMTAAEGELWLESLHEGEDYGVITNIEPDELDPNDPEQVARQQELWSLTEKTIGEQLARGEQPMAIVDGHWVRIVGTQVGPDGKTSYVVDDGTSEPRNVGVEEIGSVTFNRAYSDVPESAFNPAWDDPGKGVRGGNDMDPEPVRVPGRL